MFLVNLCVWLTSTRHCIPVADALWQSSLVNLLQRSEHNVGSHSVSHKLHPCFAPLDHCNTTVSDHEVKTSQPRPGGQDIVPSAAGQVGGGRGWRKTKMGQQGPVHADLCGVLCGTGNCLEVPLSVSESWRRQVILLWFTALFLY